KTLHSNSITGMPLLRTISLPGNHIDRIEPGAINLKNNKCEPKFSYEKPYYFLDLNSNRLKSESLNVSSISMDCATELNLSNNSLTYLPQSVYRPLFSNYVKIVLFGNALDCTDCRMIWLIKGRF